MATEDGATRDRLQKVLARAGVGSRRYVEQLIRQGRVAINGEMAELGARADLEHDHVRVDDKLVPAPHGPKRYLLLNKPPKVMSTLNDPEDRETVLHLLPERLHRGLVPVGRLDYDSEGVLLLTDDGDLAHKVAHPKHGCLKTYEVKVKGRPSEDAVEKLRAGIVLDGRRTAPAKVTAARAPSGARHSVSNSWWRVVLGEGRTRQVREMFFRIGYPVQRLRRIAIGPVTAAGLPLGRFRDLTQEEVEALRSGTPLQRGRRRPPARGAKPGAATTAKPKARRSPARSADGKPARPAAKPKVRRPSAGGSKRGGGPTSRPGASGRGGKGRGGKGGSGKGGKRGR